MTSVILRILPILILMPRTFNAKNFEYRLIQSNNIQRQELLQQKCEKYHLENNIDAYHQNGTIHSLSEVEMEHLLIDRNRKFLYCYVPKVSKSFR